MQALALALCVLGGTNPFDDYVYDPLVGETVVVIHEDAPFTTSDGNAGKLPLGERLQVTRAEGDVLQADNQGRTISLRRADVLTLPDSIAYFRKEIEQAPSANVYCALGAVQQELQKLEESLEAFDAALEIDPELTQAYLRRAWTKLKLHQYDAALADCSEVIRRRDQPGSQKWIPYAYLYRASCWQAKGDLEHAISDCSACLAKSPNNVQILLSRARLWNARGDMREARDDYKATVRLAREDAAVHLERMLFLVRHGDFAAGVEDGEATVRLDPEGQFGSVARKLTVVLLATCRDDAARDGVRAVWHADEYLRRQPGSPDALVHAATAYAETANFEKAIALQRSAITLAEQNYQQSSIRESLSKSVLEQQLKQYEKLQPCRDEKEPALLFFSGEQLFVTAVTADLLDDEGRNVGTVWSDDVVKLERVDGLRCYVSKGAMAGWIDGRHLQPVGDWIDYCDRVLATRPTARRFCNRAVLHMVRGDFERSRADFDEAVRLQPDSAVFLSERSVLRIATGDLAGAAADLAESLRLDPKLGDAYGNRAVIKLANSDYLGALADLDEAVRLKPEKTLHRRNRSVLLMTHFGEYSRGLADLDEVIRLDPEGNEGANARCGRAWHLKRKGLFQEALTDLTEAARIAPDLPEGHSHLAWLLATCPIEELRNGDAALEHALTACRLTKFAKASEIDALAAAYAELGNFEKAVEWQQVALELAEAKEREEFESRLKEYEAGRPFRHAPKFDEPEVKLPTKAANLDSRSMDRRLHARAFPSPLLSPTIGVEKG